MMEGIIDHPEIEKYIRTYESGQNVFLEGDDSQDLYILITGSLDVLKGEKNIAEITRPGALFGEMSYLLNTGRTATTKARGPVKAVKIPRKGISGFLHEFPAVSEEITRLLAQRLNETSHVLYGLTELFDQIPDAVILTDQQGQVLTWNHASRQLYGRSFDQMRHQSINDLFEEPEKHQALLDEVELKNAIVERVLKINHPQRGTRYISMSTNMLYDAQKNFQGILYLARDATVVENIKRRYERIRLWVVPSACLLALLFGAIFFGFPYFTKGIQATDTSQQILQNMLAKDFVLLKEQLKDASAFKEPRKTDNVIKKYLSIQDNVRIPYSGVLILDKTKSVFSGASAEKEKDISRIIGSNYSGIDFQGEGTSVLRVLELYRTDEEHPMGHKQIELAFEWHANEHFLGWIVFQMDMDVIKKDYNMEVKDLLELEFQK